MNTSELHTYHKIKNLPTPSRSVSVLLKSLVDENTDYQELAKTLEQFPSIAVRLISLVNSAWSSPVATIDSLDQACARLGFNVVRSISIAIAVSTPFDPSRCPAFSASRFWCDAFVTANAAGWLAAHNKHLNPQTARTAGLLHNLGLLLLAVDQPQATHEALLAADNDAELTTNQALQQYCGQGYDQAGSMLAQAWHLPDNLARATGEHLVDLPLITDELVLNTALASMMSSALTHTREYSVIEKSGKLYLPDVAVQTEVMNKLTASYSKTRDLARSLCSI